MKRMPAKKKIEMPKMNGEGGPASLKRDDFKVLTELKRALSPYWASRSQYQSN
jgi:hypothetical protein